MNDCLDETNDEIARAFARYLNYSEAELLALSDEDFYETVYQRTVWRAYKDENGFDGLTEAEKCFFAAAELEGEVYNGGLCQFFVNSSRCVAPLVSDYLEIIGAFEHKKLYDAFIKDNDIDLSSASFYEQFDLDDASEFEEKTELYPFDEFDDEFYELEPIQGKLVKYAKAHIEDFL